MTMFACEICGVRIDNPRTPSAEIAVADWLAYDTCDECRRWPHKVARAFATMAIRLCQGREPTAHQLRLLELYPEARGHVERLAGLGRSGGGPKLGES